MGIFQKINDFLCWQPTQTETPESLGYDPSACTPRSVEEQHWRENAGVTGHQTLQEMSDGYFSSEYDMEAYYQLRLKHSDKLERMHDTARQINQWAREVHDRSDKRTYSECPKW